SAGAHSRHRHLRFVLDLDDYPDGVAHRRCLQNSMGITMKLLRRRFLRLAAGAAAIPAVSRVASAQAYPTRPITMIVPFAAGGPADVYARTMAERMRVSLGQA